MGHLGRSHKENKWLLSTTQKIDVMDVGEGYDARPLLDHMKSKLCDSQAMGLDAEIATSLLSLDQPTTESPELQAFKAGIRQTSAQVGQQSQATATVAESPELKAFKAGLPKAHGVGASLSPVDEYIEE